MDPEKADREGRLILAESCGYRNFVECYRSESVP
jgi:hypothetical protein